MSTKDYTTAPTPNRDAIVEVFNPTGSGGYVLVCEHAAKAIPPEFHNLGLERDALDSHIAWDPGAFAVAQEIANRLDAPLIAQRVSRLVYDCNRPPDAPSAMPVISEVFRIPGNEGLSVEQKAARVATFYGPFHDAIRTMLDQRPDAVLVTIHSFTPTYHGKPRAVQLGILHDCDARLADAMLSGLQHSTALNSQRNQPYGPEDGVTHTLQLHAIPRGLANVMIEIRNDLVATPGQQAEIGELLAEQIASAAAGLKGSRVASHA